MGSPDLDLIAAHSIFFHHSYVHGHGTRRVLLLPTHPRSRGATNGKDACPPLLAPAVSGILLPGRLLKLRVFFVQIEICSLDAPEKMDGANSSEI